MSPNHNIRVNGEPARTDRLGHTHLTIPMWVVPVVLGVVALVAVLLAIPAFADAYTKVGGPGTREGRIITFAIGTGIAAVVFYLSFGPLYQRHLTKHYDISGPIDISDEACARRWRQINADAKAAGCKCGRPATHVQFMVGTVGGVPAQIWSCEDHPNVNNWTRAPDGNWTPVEALTLTDMS